MTESSGISPEPSSHSMDSYAAVGLSRTDPLSEQQITQVPTPEPVADSIEAPEILDL